MRGFKVRWPAVDWLSWAAATALLGLSLGSLVGALVLGRGNPGTFALENNASPEERKLLFLVLAGSVGAAGFTSLLLGLIGKERAVERFNRLAHLFSPLVIAYPLTSLLQYRVWRPHELQFLAGLAVVGFVFERTARLAVGAVPSEAIAHWAQRLTDLPGRLRRWLPLGLVLLGAAAFSTFVAYFSIQQHQRLATAAYDLGIYDNLMFNAMIGEPFRSPVLLGPSGGNYLAGHAELAMLLFVPFYAVKPGPEFLLVLQAVMLGFAALPLYLFVSTLLPRFFGVVVAYAYLFFAPLHGPAFYDFHWLPLAIFFHFWLYFAIAREKSWLIGACLTVLVLLREDVSVGLTLLGVFLTVTRLRPRLGPGLVVLGISSFVLLKFVLMPWAGSWWFADMYKDLVADGEKGYGSVVLTTLVNPMYFLSTLLKEQKLVYALHLYAPLVFLPLRWPALALLSAAGFFFTLMTTGYAPTLSISFQYTTHWIPYLFAATTLSIALLARQSLVTRALPAALALLLGVGVHSMVFGAFLTQPNFVGGFTRVPFKMSEAERKTYEGLQELLGNIPPDASVAATEALVPHVSTRRTAYTLRSHHGKAEFLLIDRSAMGGSTTSTARDAVKQGAYGLVAKRGRLFLFQRGHQAGGTEQALRELGINPGKRDAGKKSEID